MIRIATWNVNSLRARIRLVERFSREQTPHILCLQEVKGQLAQLPISELEAMGYDHIEIQASGPYHGVAIASRLPMQLLPEHAWQTHADGRHIAVCIDRGKAFQPVELHNFYVPAGGDIPDPSENPKFAHKLAFVEEMRTYLTNSDRGQERVLLGDLNIAPLPHDVWSHRQLLKVVSHTPEEVKRLECLASSGHWVDAIRYFTLPENKLYSWWSYRARDWAKSNRGRRLDHIWITPGLVQSLLDGRIFKEARSWMTPSDHVPVWIDLRSS